MTTEQRLDAIDAILTRIDKQNVETAAALANLGKRVDQLGEHITQLGERLANRSNDEEQQ